MERKQTKNKRDDKQNNQVNSRQQRERGDSEQKQTKDDMKTCATGSSYHPVYLQILEVKIKSGNGNIVPTYALLDNGSQSSLIREDFARSLNIKGANVTVNISSIKDKGEEIKVKEFALTVSNSKEDQEYTTQPVFSVAK